MAEFGQENVNEDNDTPAAALRRSRLGLVFFAIYFLLYATFVGLNAFANSVMATVVYAGLNLAVVYGMVLIIAAVVMAILYSTICGKG